MNVHRIQVWLQDHLGKQEVDYNFVWLPNLASAPKEVAEWNDSRQRCVSWLGNIVARDETLKGLQVSFADTWAVVVLIRRVDTKYAYFEYDLYTVVFDDALAVQLKLMFL
jgi:hypothetical protein